MEDALLSLFGKEINHDRTFYFVFHRPVYRGVYNSYWLWLGQAPPGPQGERVDGLLATCDNLLHRYRSDHGPDRTTVGR